VDPDGTKSERCTNNVTVQEDLVERVADGRGGLKEEESECNGALLAVRTYSWTSFK
jgi:hypothetical protein